MNKHFKLASASLAWVALLSGCAGGGGGSGSTSTSGPASLVYSGTSRAYSQAQVDSLSAEQEFKNLSQYGEIRFFAGSATESSVHPLALTNVHKAYGYGLSGNGQGIAIFDTGFSSSQAFEQGTAFVEMQTKYRSGSIKLGSPLLAGTSSHGNQVASIAGARRDAEGYNYYLNNTGLRYPSFVSNSYDLLNHGMMGVAYGATLHLYDVDSLNTFGLLADSIRSIATQGVVVQNNSWGLSTDTNTGRRFNRSQVIALPATLPESVATGTIEAASSWLESITGFSAASWTDYLSALQTYQDKGVTVFALQNDRNAAQPSLLAALPELVPSLKPAWIAVGNIDTFGTSTLSITRQSAACGKTAPYCLVVDGTEITGAGLSNSGGGAPGYSFGQSGTSFAAPQVSGMIALLAEAFPTLKPEDLVNRLLATANNSFFTPTAERVFSNEIKHGYNDEFGHGIPDVYAALQPITSGSRPLSFVLNGSPRSGQALPVASTSLRTSPALSREVQKTLSEKTIIGYDALGAGFQVPMTRLLEASSRQTRLSDWLAASLSDVKEEGSHGGVFHSDTGLSLASGMSLAQLSDELHGQTSGKVSPSDNRAILNNVPGIPSQYADGFVLSEFQMASGLRLSGLGELIGYVGNTKTLVSPSPSAVAAQPNVYGAALNLPFAQSSTGSGQLLLGLQREADALRGSQGTGALRLAQHSHSFFISPSLRYADQGWSFSAGMSIGLTKAQAGRDSFVRSAGSLVSSEFYALASVADVLKPYDMGYLRVWQPETIESGSLNLKVPQLVGPQDTVRHSTERISLASRHRDIFLGLGYQQRLSPMTSLQHEFVLLPSAQNQSGQAPELGITVRLHHRF
jgi:subtilase-type serine protease